jgi:hypothetical protein
METQLQQIIEESNRKLVEAKAVGNHELANALQILIAEAEVSLKGLENAD